MEEIELRELGQIEPVGTPASGPEENSEQNENPLIDEALEKELLAIPDKMAFKIGEVAGMVGVKSYVLRYWETEFDVLRPKKSASNQRMYTRKDVETVFLIKKLLYRDRFSIEGARKALRGLRTEVRQQRNWNDVATRYDKAILELENLIDSIDDIKGVLAQ